MTIRKGETWGETGPVPPGIELARSDAEAAAIVTSARRSGRPVPAIGLLGGDLCRTLGGTGDEERLRAGPASLLPVDLGAVLIDGRLHWFVAHLVVRRPWWRGRVVVAMNAQFLGPWDVAPRGHPNDGRLEVLEGELPLGERLKVRSRLPTGTHLPHPGISERHLSAVQVELDTPTSVVLDGVPMGSARALSIRVEPDALTCVV